MLITTSRTIYTLGTCSQDVNTTTHHELFGKCREVKGQIVSGLVKLNSFGFVCVILVFQNCYKIGAHSSRILYPNRPSAYSDGVKRCTLTCTIDGTRTRLRSPTDNTYLMNALANSTMMTYTFRVSQRVLDVVGLYDDAVPTDWNQPWTTHAVVRINRSAGSNRADCSTGGLHVRTAIK